MAQRILYLAQIIEKIGAPLLVSVLSSMSTNDPSSASPDEAIKSEAHKIAKLLGKTVQLSIELGHIVEIDKSDPAQIESLRVALAGLSGPMIASLYSNTGRTPAEADLKKMSGALEAVMTFSDNFSPSDESTTRLKTLQADARPTDHHQTNLQYLQAFVPVADAIAGFSFGQTEKKMMQDAAEKINTKARQLSQSIADKAPSSLDIEAQKPLTLALVKALADIFTLCHRAEMKKIMALQDPDISAQTNSLASLWDNFELRAAMLETLADHLFAGNIASSAQSSGNKVASPLSQPQNIPNADAATTTGAPATMPPAPPPPAQPQIQAPPAQQQAPPASSPAATNPMSMFVKPKADDSGAAAQPVQPTQAPQSQDLPQPPPQATPPQTTPPPAVETPPQSQGQGQGEPPQEKSAGGNPMSFFKSPPKEGEDS
ncbi:MAG: hypothetical protein ACK4VI_04800 [Alphaproteobacteria bacterium]